MLTPPQRADPSRLEEHVRTLAEDLTPRDADHPERLPPVADYVEAQLAPHAPCVTDQCYSVAGTTIRNVIARFGPDAGAQPKTTSSHPVGAQSKTTSSRKVRAQPKTTSSRKVGAQPKTTSSHPVRAQSKTTSSHEVGARIVVGAHYDTAGPHPGADDNASGVAGLLELARLLDGADLARPVELVGYPLEEPPYFSTSKMGSAVHARSLREQGVAVRAMLSLEMIGYFTDEPNSQALPLSLLRPFYPSEGNFIAVVGRWGWGQRRLVRTVRDGMQDATPLPVHSINAPRLVPGVAFSDHRNYWQAGYDAVMITDTAFYRNPHYHAPSDTPETLDYGRMAQVVDGVRGAIATLGAPRA
jgi:Zn-dependent M28 family amino/carboxypeptidase